MPYLRFLQDDGNSSEVLIDAEHSIIRIGRAVDCDIRTGNHSVSRRHSQVVFTGSSYRLTDLKSSNGTFFNRERIEEHDLKLGDIFYCGNFEVLFTPESLTGTLAPDAAPGPDGTLADHGYEARWEAPPAAEQGTRVRMATEAPPPLPELPAALTENASRLGQYVEPLGFVGEVASSGGTVAGPEAPSAGGNAELDALAAALADANDAIVQWQAHVDALEAVHRDEINALEAERATLTEQSSLQGARLADAEAETARLKVALATEETARTTIEQRLKASELAGAANAEVLAELESLRADWGALSEAHRAQTAELEAARAEAATLEASGADDGAAVATLTAERDDALLAWDEAVAERDEALAARDAAVADRDEALAARDAAISERDEALAARDAAVLTGDDATSAVAEAALARDQAASERDEAVLARDQAASERDEAILARDQATSERDEAVLARDQAASERDQALAEVERWQVRGERLRIELDAARAGMGDAARLGQEAQSAREELSAASAARSELEREHNLLKTQLREQTSESNAWRARMDGVVAERDQLHRERDEAREAVERWQARVERLREELSSAESIAGGAEGMRIELAQLKEALVASEAQAVMRREALTQELGAARAEATAAGIARDALTVQRDELATIKEQLISERDTAREALERSQNRVERLREDLATAEAGQSESAALRGMVEELQRAVAGAEAVAAARDVLAQELGAARAEVATVGAARDEALAACAQARSEVVAGEKARKELEKTLAQRDASLTEAQTAKKAAASGKAEHDAKVKQLTAERDAAVSECGQLTRQLERLQDRILGIEGASQEAGAATEKQLAEAQAAVKRLERERDTAAATASAKATEVEQLQKNLGAMERQLGEAQGRLEAGAGDAAAHAADAEALEVRVRELKAALADATGKVRELETALDEATRSSERGAEVRETLASVQDELKRTQDKLARSREQEERLRKDLDKAQAAPRGGSGGDDALKSELDLVYQDLNGVTRQWRGDVITIGDLVQEIQERGSIAAAGVAINKIGEILSQMNDASSDIKQSLRQMRHLIAGEE